MPLRVIAGIAKGRKLNLVPGDTTRPIMDRVKEALFSILGRRIFGCLFLDVFAGTGSVGIEALSRGAQHAVLLDLDARAVQTIRDNLALTRLSDKATVKRADAFVFLAAQPDRAYHFIYLAPPQYHDMWRQALLLIDSQPHWLTDDGTVIVQIDPKEYKATPLNTLALTDQRKYGNTLLLFFDRLDPHTGKTSPEVQPPHDRFVPVGTRHP